MNNATVNKSYCLVALVFIVICFFPHPVYGQSGPAAIDSLKQLLQNAKTDTDKVNYLLMLSENTACADSTSKINYANEALQLTIRINWEKGMILADISVGDFHVKCMKNQISAIKYYAIADSIAIKNGDLYNQAKALSGIANDYKDLAQYGKAIEYYKEVIALKANPDLEIGALGNMGIVYQAIGDYPAALACYDSSLKETEGSIRANKKSDQTDTAQMAGLLITIGDIYQRMHEYDKALKMGEQTDFKMIEVMALMGIATAYSFQHAYDKAIDYYSKALDGCQADNDKNHETAILYQMGLVYSNNEENMEALEYTQRSLQLAIENNDPDLQADNYILMGKIYNDLKDYNKAVSYLTKAITITRQTGALDLQKDALQIISNAYKQMNKTGPALEAYEQFIAIRDSLYNINKLNELTRIDLQSGYERSKIADSTAQAGEYKLKMQKQLAYTWGGYTGLALVLLLSFFIYRNYAQEKKAVTAITKANKTISEQKQVSETLLLNILPADVADELKTKGKVKAKLYDNVTVMFTDFVNFTAAGERLSPEELVEELHTCFEAFDNIMGRYKIEKIKTVGDAYVAVSGLPTANPSHASDMIRAAIDIRDFIAARKNEMGDATFGVRIGINSGKLVAGIVGVKKFAYDIWGDTVNTAARMEQTGEEGKINITQATYQLIKDEYACTYRGEIEAKNKGKLKMYFVTPEPLPM